jgi:hypothetical protein
MRHAEKLCAAGYLKDLTPELRNKPHIYIDTGKASIRVKISVANCNVENDDVAPNNATVAGCNATVAESELNKVLKKDSNKYLKIIQAQARTHWGNNFGAWHKVEKVLEAAIFERTDHTLVISGLGLQAAVYQDRYAETFEHDFFGALNERIKVRFE